MGKKPPVAKSQSADDDIALAKKIKVNLFSAILKATHIHASPEKDVLLIELRRALNATASLRAKLGDIKAYTENQIK